VITQKTEEEIKPEKPKEQPVDPPIVITKTMEMKSWM